MANLQSAVFYPLNSIFLLMPIARAFSYGAILHLFLAGWFMFAFLRVLGLRRSAALLGGVAYMFNGCIIAWLEYPTFSLWVNIWLPLALYLYEQALRRRSFGFALLAGVVLGVQFLGGQLQYSGYLLIAFLLYALVRSLSGKESGGERMGRFGLAMVAIILGGVLASLQLLPTLELVPRSIRPAALPGSALSTALPFTHLIIYLIPNFFGTPAHHHNYWGHLGQYPINFFETSGYVGILTLVLAVLGIWQWRKAHAKFFIILAAFSLLMALGTPLYYLFFYAVPPFRQLAGLARILCLNSFALAGLAAVGADYLMKQEKRDLRVFCWTFGGLAVAAVLGAIMKFSDLVFSPMLEEFELRQIAAFLILLVLSLGLIYARSRGWLPSARSFGIAAISLLVADLFCFGINFNPACDPKMAFFETDSIKYLRENLGNYRMMSVGKDFRDWMPANTPMVYGLNDIQGTDSLWYRGYHRFLKTMNPQAPTFDWPNLDSPQLDLLGVKYLLTSEYITSPKWELVYDRDGKVYLNRKVMPRVISSQVSRAEIADYLPNQVTVDVQSTGEGELLLTDVLYPGWQAEVDGAKAQIEAAYGIFRQVQCPAGEHEIVFKFQPISFRLGLFLSLCGLGIVAAGLAVWGKR